jgi:tellurite resistance protein TerC
VKNLIIRTFGQARRLIIIVAGFTVLIIGVAMIVLPGPAVVVIPIGLTILATEFIWARTLLTKVKERVLHLKITRRSK